MKDLFLCHSGVDKLDVEELGHDVECEQWNGRPLSVFFDAWDIPVGGNIPMHLSEALDKARFVALVMSPEMLASDWCQAEVNSLLAADPTNKKGRIVPIRLRDKHKVTGAPMQVPALLRALNYLDFTTPDNKRRDFRRLLALLRGEPPPRRSSKPAVGPSPVAPAIPQERAASDPIGEVLVSNLLPVIEIPEVVWSTPTQLQRTRDLPAGTTYPVLIVREGKLFSFTNPDDDPLLRSLVAGAAKPTSNLLRSWRDDVDRWRWAIELFNRHLRRELGAHQILWDHSHNRYFFSGRAQRTVTVRWGTGTKRVVVRKPDNDGEYWVHTAARLRFETLGPALYLSVEPSMVFTRDGIEPVGREVAGPLAMQWTGKERNGAVLRNLLLWSDAITAGKHRAYLNAGTQAIVIGRLPTRVLTSVGIADDFVKVGALLAFGRADAQASGAHEQTFEFVSATEGSIDGIESEEGEVEEEDE